MTYVLRVAALFALTLAGCEGAPEDSVSDETVESAEVPEVESEASVPQSDDSDAVTSGVAFMALAEGQFVLERRQIISGRDPGGMSASPNYRLTAVDGYEIYVLVTSASGDQPTDALNQSIVSSEGTTYQPVGFGVPMASPAHSGTQITFLGSVDPGGTIGIVSSSPSSFLGQVYVLPTTADGLYLAGTSLDAPIMVHTGPLKLPAESSTDGLNLSARLDFGYSVENTIRN